MMGVMKNTTLIPLALLAACGGPSRTVTVPEPPPPPQAHDGTYRVTVGPGAPLDPSLEPCGFLGGQEFVADVTVDPPHITLDGLGDDQFLVAEFSLARGDQLRVAGSWMAASADGSMGYSATVSLYDLDGAALGDMAFLLLMPDLSPLCGERATLSGTFTPAP